MSEAKPVETPQTPANVKLLEEGMKFTRLGPADAAECMANALQWVRKGIAMEVDSDEPRPEAITRMAELLKETKFVAKFVAAPASV